MENRALEYYFVYKFMPARFALSAMETQTLKVATFDSLNDPFDMLPAIIGSGDVDKNMEAFARDWRAAVGAEEGLLCACGSCSDPAVWAHYADGHSGMALKLSFPKAYTVPVEYRSERASVRLRDPAAVPVAELEAHQLELYRRKGPSWQCEEEYRMRVKLNACTKRDGMYFADLRLLILTQVILGYRCKVDPADVRRALGQYHSHVEIVTARLSRTRFEIVADA